MPGVEVVWYQERPGGDVPALEWLQGLEAGGTAEKEVAGCLCERIERLGEVGNLLRPPESTKLPPRKLLELRCQARRVQYRLLYGWGGKGLAVLVYGTTKDKEIPKRELDIAERRLAAFKNAPDYHRYPER
jgi:phage-related protein